MNLIHWVIIAIWIVVGYVFVKAWIHRNEPPTDNYTPSPRRNTNEVVNVHSKAKEHAVEAPQQSRGKHSTRNIVIITTIVVIAFVIIGNLSKETPEVQTPKQYVPKYSADQVIAVVRGQYPICFKGNTLITAPTQISVEFMGGTSHAWRATITAPEGYHMTTSFEDKVQIVYSRVVYFWETDGSLHNLSEELPDIFK